MQTSPLRIVIAFLILGNAQWLDAHTAVSQRGVIATVHPLATDAGVEMLRHGGNAIDAAVAAALTLGVVDGHNSGIGGGCFILVRLADGQFVAVDGRETAPAAATRDMFVRDGKAIPELSRIGPLAAGVPGALAAYDEVMRSYGRFPLADPLRHAAKIASRGFAIDRIYARNLAASAAMLRHFRGSSEMLLKADGTAYVAGDVLRLTDLAESYAKIAERGIDWFYRGSFAERTATWMAANGGLITEDDFRNYRAKKREPLVTSYRDYQVVGFPPPSSGGIHVAQILNILEQFDIEQMLSHDPATAYHVIGEAMKLAFADRAHWLGDADFAPVPRGLISKRYAKNLAQQIHRGQVTPVQRPGVPPGWQKDVFGKHTTHIAAADEHGNWVAITATVNTSFGSKVVIPGTGVVLNNQMDDFSSQPGVPNVFGLVGAEANAVEPGKRPLSSMSPTIVLKNGQPVMSVGAAGGPKIISQVVLAIVNHLDVGLSLEESVSRRRLHHQWRPNRFHLERDFDPDLAKELVKKGHELDWYSGSGVTQAIARQPDGRFIGVSDPRVPGKAAGY